MTCKLTGSGSRNAGPRKSGHAKPCSLLPERCAALKHLRHGGLVQRPGLELLLLRLVLRQLLLL